MPEAMKRVESQQKLVIVLGMHRSGTSAITRGLKVIGVELGDRLEPPAAGINDKGYWEDMDLVALNVEMLDVCGRSWHSLDPIQEADVEVLLDRGYILRAIELLRSKILENRSFGFKDPRTAKMLPFWAHVFEAGSFDVRYVLAVRNPLSVAKSLGKRDGFDQSKSYLLWAEHILTSLSNVGNWPVLVMDYDELMLKPDEQLGKLARWMGAEIDFKELESYREEFLDEQLRHSRFSASDVYSDMAAPGLVHDIHRHLDNIGKGLASVDDLRQSGVLENWLLEFNRMRPVLKMVDRLHGRLQGKEKEISHADNEAVERERIIAEKDKQILEKDQLLIHNDHRIIQKDHQIVDAGSQLLDRDRKILDLDNRLMELTKQIVDRDIQLAEQQKLIAGRDQSVVVADKGLDIAKATIDELNERVAGLELLLARSNSEVEQQRRDLMGLIAALEAMRSSASWRWTAPLRRILSSLLRVQHVLHILPNVIKAGGGVVGTARTAAAVLGNEGAEGVRKRLALVSREVEIAEQIEAADRVEAVASRNEVTRLLPVPYYVDPRLDEQRSEAFKSLRAAIHLHVFEISALEAAAKRLSVLPCQFDLYVSIAPGLELLEVLARLREFLSPSQKVVGRTTTGFTQPLAAMILEFGAELSGYRIVGHFHAGGGPGHDGALARLLGGENSSNGRVAHFLELLQEKAKIVFAGSPTVDEKAKQEWHVLGSVAERLLKEHGQAPMGNVQPFLVPTGVMFWAQTENLRDFLKLPIDSEDFSEVLASGHGSGTLEYLLPVLAKNGSGKYIFLEEGDSIKDYGHYEACLDYSESIVYKDVKVLAYYLPQFHPIPENDEWHGKGFTEWTKVRAANPLFEGHYQQHIPHPDLGYYLLDGPDTLRRQAELMKKSGVYGQVFYHYWFAGKMILEQPARMLLAHQDVAMPFSFCWANENWTRRWDGNEKEILLGQNYSAEDARAFMEYLIPFFKDPRYIRVNDRPMLSIYRPSSIPNIDEYLEVWAEVCAEAGLPKPYVVAVLTRGATDPKDFGMDAGTERVLHDWTDGGAPEIKQSLKKYWPVNGSVLSYDDVANFYMGQTEKKDFKYFRSIVPIWDNTARYGSEALLLHGSTPESFQKWMESTIQYTVSTLEPSEQFIFVNAWNEWAEGAHLEPDTRYGYSYLNSVGRALSGVSYASQLNYESCIPEKINIHIDFSENAQGQLQAGKTVRDRMLNSLKCSTILKRFNVTSNIGLTAFAPIFSSRGNMNDADVCVYIERACIFSSHVLEKMISTAWSTKADVISNSYGDQLDLIRISSNGSVDREVAAHAPLRVRLKNQGNCSNSFVRLRTDAWAFDLKPDTLNEESLPKVTTIIRFHKTADVSELENALSCLNAMWDCSVTPLIAAQDLDSEKISLLHETIGKFSWKEGCEPIVDEYQSGLVSKDLRSRMLNESLKKVNTRYCTFLDYDDLIFPTAYARMIDRLKLTEKSVTFGRVFSTACKSRLKLLVERKRAFEYGLSFGDFVNCNHAPLHSFLLDLSKINVAEIKYYEDQRYMEDYLLTLQIFEEDNADWESLKNNMYIGDYIHSSDRDHTLALNDDEKRKALLSNSEYLICEDRINQERVRIRKKITSVLS
ncbi:hypothetical protein FB549_5220 [Delftia sp. HK171]|nr:hypothetical protein FB549_5220 [Delftia sp. HK171]